MKLNNQNHSAYWAFILHRFSGVILALFLPIHFFILRLAIDDVNAMDTFLKWTTHPLVGLAEAGLVFLLAAHLTGGLRLLAIEFLPWHNWQKTSLALAAGVSFSIMLAFLMSGI